MRKELADRTDGLRILGIAVLALFAFWMTVILYAVDSSVPTNAIKLPMSDRFRVNSLIPQGWGFFTRSPREPNLIPYLRKGSSWIEASLAPHSEPRHLLGFRRASKGQAIEMAILLAEIGQDDWLKCKRTISEDLCLERAGRARTFRSAAEVPTLCGDVGFIERRPTPWAWGRSDLSASMPVSAVRLMVLC